MREGGERVGREGGGGVEIERKRRAATAQAYPPDGGPSQCVRALALPHRVPQVLLFSNSVADERPTGGFLPKAGGVVPMILGAAIRARKYPPRVVWPLILQHGNFALTLCF